MVHILTHRLAGTLEIENRAGAALTLRFPLQAEVAGEPGRDE
ncbi:MAG: hypothetical protein ACE147_04870 [Candidatus Methylomirabilales bacterium]